MRQEQGTGDVASLKGQFARIFLLLAILTLTALLSVGVGRAAPYAAIVVDARTGETIYASNADTRLHPASLTKMLTLYIAFDAIQRGEISLDTMITVSRNAASKPPSRLGLKAGQRIALRHLIRAAAVKSANDAASAIGDALGGSEAAFARRMNATAKAIGMKNSSFRNANGLTDPGHLSTARDMNHLGRRLFYDFPQYYNIFSRRSADAGVAKVNNTNSRFLAAYKGADGIKTGYTSAAGFNLTASAERGNTRIIATVFGGTSTAQRNAKMASLLDLGFKEAPANARVRKPAPADIPGGNAQIASADIDDENAADDPRSAGKTIRLVMSLKTSPRPRQRPGTPAQAEAAAEAVMAMQDGIAGALALATTPPAPAAPAPAAEPAAIDAAIASARPEPKPETLSQPEPVIVAKAADAVIAPPPSQQKPVAPTETTIVALAAPAALPRPKAPAEPEVVTRVSTSGGRHWGINLGRFASRSVAERTLMKTALSESTSLKDGLRKVIERSGGYDANFMGLTREQADLACRRLQARAIQCFTIGQ